MKMVDMRVTMTLPIGKHILFGYVTEERDGQGDMEPEQQHCGVTLTDGEEKTLAVPINVPVRFYLGARP